jgi:ribosomal protein S27E
MGVSHVAWTSIRHVLKVPHFSFTKRLNLVYEEQLPTIFSESEIVPKLDTSGFFVYVEPDGIPQRMFYTMCTQCYETELRYNQQIDAIKCVYCGHEMVYEHPFDYVRQTRKLLMARKFSTSFYKRVVHFKFWLKRLQGKEKNKVTQQVIDDVQQLLEKNNYKVIHYWIIRNALKRLHYEEFYDNAIFILSKIRGTPLVNLTRNQENILVEMFMSLEHVFITLKNQRVNMLSYPYVIKKLCELKGWFTMAKIIPTLKSHVRIVIQDELWRKICLSRKWNFISTAQWTSLETRAPNGKLR